MIAGRHVSRTLRQFGARDRSLDFAPRFAPKIADPGER
jgi:hypothetical protein